MTIYSIGNIVKIKLLSLILIVGKKSRNKNTFKLQQLLSVGHLRYKGSPSPSPPSLPSELP